VRAAGEIFFVHDNVKDEIYEYLHLIMRQLAVDFAEYLNAR
jgi:hypothetical protein